MGKRGPERHPFASFEKRTLRRLILRPFCADDFAAWQCALAALGPARNQWDTGPQAPQDLTRSRFRSVLAQQKRSRERGSMLILGAFARRSGQLLGIGVLENPIFGPYQTVHLGFEVLNTHWGQGHGTEIARGLIAIAFKDLGLHRVEALVHPANKRSQHLVRSIGMRREGVSRQRFYSRRTGGWRDMIVFAMTDD